MLSECWRVCVWCVQMGLECLLAESLGATHSSLLGRRAPASGCGWWSLCGPRAFWGLFRLRRILFCLRAWYTVHLLNLAAVFCFVFCVFLNKVLLERNCAHFFDDGCSLATKAELSSCGRETEWSIKPKRFSIWSFPEKLPRDVKKPIGYNKSLKLVSLWHSLRFCSMAQLLSGFSLLPCPPSLWMGDQSCRVVLGDWLSHGPTAIDSVLRFLCWIELGYISHKLTYYLKVWKWILEPGETHPSWSQLLFCLDDSVQIPRGWGTAQGHIFRWWLSGSPLGLLALVPIVFPQRPCYCCAYTQTKHVPCNLGSPANLFFISAVCRFIPGWRERNDLCSEEKAKILFMLRWCSLFLHCALGQYWAVKQKGASFTLL